MIALKLLASFAILAALGWVWMTAPALGLKLFKLLWGIQ